MEGFLSKRGKGETTFGRKSWKKRWFILEGNHLTYFEDFGTTTGKPVNQKGIVPVYGSSIVLLKDPGNEFAFDIVHPDRRTLSLRAPDKRLFQCKCDGCMQMVNCIIH